MEARINGNRPAPVEGEEGMTPADLHVYACTKAASEAGVPLAARLDDEDPRVIAALVKLAGSGYLNITES